MIRRIALCVALLWSGATGGGWADTKSNSDITVLQRQIVEAYVQKDIAAVRQKAVLLEKLIDQGQAYKGWSRTAQYGLLAELMFGIKEIPEAARYYAKAVNAARHDGLWIEGEGLNVRIELGNTLLLLEKPDEAGALGKELLSDLERQDAVQSDLGMKALALVATAELNLGNLGAASSSAQRLLDIAAVLDPGGRMTELAKLLLANSASRGHETARRAHENPANGAETTPANQSGQRSRLKPDGSSQKQLEALQQIAEEFFASGQLDAFEHALQQALSYASRQPGISDEQIAKMMVRLSQFRLDYRGDLDGAHALLSRAIELLDRTLGSDHIETLRARAEWIYAKGIEIDTEDVWRRTGRRPVFWDGSHTGKVPTDAELEIYRRLAEVEQRTGSRNEAVTAAMNYVGLATRAGRHDDAIAALRLQIELQEKARGQGGQKDPEIDFLLINTLGGTLLEQGKYDSAAKVLSDGLDHVLIYLRDPTAFTEPSRARRLHIAGQLYGEKFATAAWKAGQAHPTKDQRAFHAWIFDALQLAGYGPATYAVAQASIRNMAKDPELADLAKDWQQANRSRNDEYAQRLRDELNRKFPEFFEWRVPAPLHLDEVQTKLVRPDEAILMILPAAGQSGRTGALPGLVMAVTAEDAVVAELPLNWDQLVFDIMGLHNSLDPAGRGLRAPLASIQPENSTQSARRNPPFEFGAAHRLYEAFFGPSDIMELAGPKRFWTVIPFGEAMSVPFPALVVEKAGIPEDTARSDEDLRQVRWLGHQRAMNIVPSVAALSALRSRDARPSQGSESQLTYIGFGDPKFAGLTGSDLPAADRVMRGTVADRAAALLALPPLPATRREVETLAQLFGAESSQLFLGDNATETRIRNLSEDGQLRQAKILHLATHGLLSGAFEDLAEPALALTPQTGSADASLDGLLTASEAARLNIDADWVILSACDTAGEVSIAGDGLGGLVQGFFSAGARNLLVSHWRVDDQAAERLITETVAASQSGMEKAEALRLAMWALAADPSRDGTGFSYAHPSMWAPFFLVGGG